jgi:hypothetical protein
MTDHNAFYSPAASNALAAGQVGDAIFQVRDLVKVYETAAGGFTA